MFLASAAEYGGGSIRIRFISNGGCYDEDCISKDNELIAMQVSANSIAVNLMLSIFMLIAACWIIRALISDAILSH